MTRCCCGVAVGREESGWGRRTLFPAGAPARNTQKCVGCRAVAAAAALVAPARLAWLADTD